MIKCSKFLTMGIVATAVIFSSNIYAQEKSSTYGVALKEVTAQFDKYADFGEGFAEKGIGFIYNKMGTVADSDNNPCQVQAKALKQTYGDLRAEAVSSTMKELGLDKMSKTKLDYNDLSINLDKEVRQELVLTGKTHAQVKLKIQQLREQAFSFNECRKSFGNN